MEVFAMSAQLLCLDEQGNAAFAGLLLLEWYDSKQAKVWKEDF